MISNESFESISYDNFKQKVLDIKRVDERFIGMKSLEGMLNEF